jgi:glycosyltransferase involved in cell wall biosynthesis
MKVAIIHDYIKEYGGAERVLEALTEIWSNAPIYTTVYLPKFLGPHQDRVKNWKVIPSFLQKIPFKEKLISPFRLIAPLVFDNLDLSDFDVIIVSATGAYNPNLIVTKPETLHICYCHTPPRYLYGLPTARDWKKHWWGRVAGELVNHFLRQVDFLSAQRVDYFIANSVNTANRIKKFYRRDCVVVYPPVETSKQISDIRYPISEYYLTGGRLARPKHIDIAVEACTKLNLPLKVFGRMFADYGEELKKLAGPTIEFLGEVDEKQKAELYAGCKAFIFPAEEEDFGIMPVEAMSFGKPVIALKQGGVLETVIDGKTGTFFEQPTVESLVSKLQSFKAAEFKPEDCRKQAEKFSKERFKTEILDFVNKHARVT